MQYLNRALLVCFLQGLAPAAPYLIPAPQKMEPLPGTLELPARVSVRAEGPWATRVQRYAWVLEDVLGKDRIAWSDDNAAIIRIIREEIPGASTERYALHISPTGVQIRAATTAGVFNALATLAQIVEQTENPKRLPCCRIEDAPALAVRAGHIDMTCQQYTGSYVCRLMRIWARYKVNAILMEYSDMFPFRRHKGICRPDALSEQDIVTIRRTAEECNQEIIPFLQCLGHLQYVLHKPDYERLGKAHQRYMLCPSSKEALPLVRELIDEIVEQHPGVQLLHVGGDEVDVGRGGECPSCRDYAKRHGFSALYVHHYSQVARYCESKQVTPLMWSDMILQHPAAITEMPRNVAWVVWDYDTRSDPAPSMFHGAGMGRLDKLSPDYRKYFGEGIGLADADKRGGLVAFGHALGFRSLGFDVFTAPAARCAGDNYDLPRFDLHMNNVDVACRKAADFRLPGTIVTSWSYRGSPQEVCLPEYACIAAAWNRSSPKPAELMRHFLAERYGIDDASLARSMIALSPIVPPSCMGTPELDDARGAWVVGGRRQLQQVRDALKTNPEAKRQQWRSWRAQVREVADRLGTWSSRARRNDELRHWRLSLEHLSHRLAWLQAVADVVSLEKREPSAAGLAAHTAERERLRAEWARLYAPIHTPPCLAAELYTRFDAEAEVAGLIAEHAAQN